MSEMIEKPIPTWSITRKTLLEVIPISEDERLLFWDGRNNESLSVIDFSESEWKRLTQYSFFQDDPIESIFASSISYLIAVWDSENSFQELIYKSISYLETVFGHSLSEPAVVFSDELIFKGMNFGPLEDLLIAPDENIPAQCVTAAHRMDIFCWAQLERLSERRVVKKLGFTVEAIQTICLLWELQKQISAQLQSVVRASQTWETFEKLLSELLYSETRAHILCRRIGIRGFKPPTLEEVGNEIGVTRERIRQIEKKSWEIITCEQKGNSRDYLAPLYFIINSIVYGNCGIIHSDQLIDKVCQSLNWPEVPNKQGFSKIILIDDKFESCGDSEYLAVGSFDCLQCSDAGNLLQDTLDDIEESSFSVVADRFMGNCRLTCKNTGKLGLGFPLDVSQAFLTYVLFTVPQLRDDYVINNGTVYSRNRRDLKYGRLSAAVLAVLRETDSALHFTDVQKRVMEFRVDGGRNFTERNVYATLDRSQDTALWGKGSFILREKAVFPYGLIRRVEKWLARRLMNDIPFMSVWGAFQYYKEECINENIPNEYALYSCLRESNDPLFVYPHCPYVYLEERYKERIPLPIALEEYLEDAGGPISKKELKHFATEKIFIKEIMWPQLSEKIPNVLRTKDWGFLHRDLFELNEEELGKLIKYTKNLNSAEGHVSVNKIFNDKKISCAIMEIDSPEMLFSLFQTYAPDKFNMTKYPQIRKKEKEKIDSKKRDWIYTEVISYLREKKAVCTYEELESLFVDKLGYSEQTVYAVALRNDIYRYTVSSLVHPDIIAWNEEKKVIVENIAKKQLLMARQAGSYFACVENILESKELPALGNDLYWTSYLLSDILSKDDKFKVLGNRKNAFVEIPNDQNIDSLEDLVAEILKKEFHGAENIERFAEYLREKGVIKKQMTKSMLHLGKVEIIGKEITLARLL